MSEEELSEEELAVKYLTLGKLFDEIIKFPDAAMYIRTHFDIKVDQEKEAISVIRVPDSEVTKRVMASMETTNLVDADGKAI